MFFHRNVTYGIKAVILLSVFKDNRIRSSKEISEELQIPKEFTSKILQSLTKNGIIYSRKGKGGGFCLAKHPSEIRIIDIISGLGEDDKYDFCLLGINECTSYLNCPVQASLKMLKVEFYDLIYNHSIEELINEEWFNLKQITNE